MKTGNIPNLRGSAVNNCSFGQNLTKIVSLTYMYFQKMERGKRCRGVEGWA